MAARKDYCNIFEPVGGLPPSSGCPVTREKSVLSISYDDTFSFFKISISGDTQVNFCELQRDEIENFIQIASGFLESRDSLSVLSRSADIHQT